MKEVRLPFLIGLMIPLSFVMAALLMRVTGMSLNIISLSGLILAAGLLVDNGIVMLEGIMSNHLKGVSAERACLRGIREMLPPLAGSNLTTLVILVPLLTGGGLLAYIFGEEAKTMMATIICSLLLALFLLPVLYILVFRGRYPLGENRIYAGVKRKCLHLSAISYRYPGMIIVIHTIGVVMVGYMGSFLPVELTPEQRDRHWVVEAAVSENGSMLPGPAGDVELIPSQTGYILDDESFPIYNVYGAHALEEARRLAASLKVSGIRPGGDPVSALFNASAPEVEVVYAGQARAMDKFLSEIRKPGRSGYRSFSGKHLSRGRKQLLGPLATPVPESSERLAVHYTVSDSVLHRPGRRPVYARNVLQEFSYSGMPVITGNLIGRTAKVPYSATEFNETGESHMLEARSRGISARIGGKIHEGMSLGKDLLRMGCLSFGLLYMVLLIQFGSAWWPLPVIAVLPVGLAGSVSLLYMTGQSINIMSGIGLIAMLGIIVNDAILKVSAVRRHWNAGSTDQVLRRSLEIRLRPILMTTGTTLISCVPVLFMPGAGNELQRSLVIALMGGVFSATFAAIFLIPALIKWGMRIKASVFCNRPAVHPRR